ncbi:hypothetical protein SPSIL_010300 [Sporomusa silvacetica DSM 10669]|uniref:Carboxypeptidase regulatory-like domain-containing protein n=1 Tax=Sporomusa silvacetica DSM 10669 TaxID=1123289 RepID=A0ABZ3IGY2_9FIRM|nr:carboxypeptidase-like regulatory domain-containing protein [Sporomusa silvacetica]OZC21456.1 hypothetical protein SPSIL_10610 [Sporomusa silvacetica DSM 10669]
MTASNKRTLLLIIFTCILTFLLFLGSVNASNGYPISGKITDSSLKPIVGAKIVFEMDGGKNIVYISKTNARGNYEVNVPEKNKFYWVTIGKDGHKTYRGKVYLSEETLVFDFNLNR